MANPQPIPTRPVEKPYSADQFTQWLTESCQRQHLPTTITIPTILPTIAVLLR